MTDKDTGMLFGQGMRQKCRVNCGIFGTLCLLALPVLARMDPALVGVNINGTIVANASCTINSQSPIQVSFGDVYINEIDTGGYRKEIPYSLICKGDPDGKSIEMRLAGAGADFDGNVLKTSINGLGIKILSNNNQITPNSWFTINADSPPSLAAVVVGDKNAHFSNGQRFDAAAMLVVDYR